MGKSGKSKKMPTKTSEIEFSPKVVQSNQNECMIDEKIIRRLMESVDALTKKYDLIQEEVSSIKSSQNKLIETQSALNVRVDNIEKNLQNWRHAHERDEIKEELEEVKKKNDALFMAQGNDRIIMRNFPLEIQSDQQKIRNVIHKVLNVLKIDVSGSHFEAFSVKAADKESANIVVKFSSSMMKSQVVKRYREAKKIKPFDSLRVDNLTELAQSHHLSGKSVMISNKLNNHSTRLIFNARKYVNSHFDFVFDSPEGNIFAKVGGSFHKIETDSDIEKLVKKINYEKNMALLKIELKKYYESSRLTNTEE